MRRTTVGTVAPAWLAALPGLAGAGLSMRIFGSALARAIPKDETEAVSRETLIGRPGVVTGGVARRGLPAQIRVPDAFGMNHYLLAEPEDEAEQLPIGTSVIVVSIEDNRGRVMRDPMMTVGTAQNQ
ncbi:MAG: OB-fold-containig protein [Pseudomonadota bacterium]